MEAGRQARVEHGNGERSKSSDAQIPVAFSYNFVEVLGKVRVAKLFTLRNTPSSGPCYLLPRSMVYRQSTTLSRRASLAKLCKSTTVHLLQSSLQLASGRKIVSCVLLRDVADDTLSSFLEPEEIGKQNLNSISINWTRI